MGHEYGTTIKRISAKGVGYCERDFPSFIENFALKNKSHYDVLEYHFKDVFPHI